MMNWQVTSMMLATTLSCAVAASDNAEKTFFSRHKGPIVATAVSTTVALAFFVANRIAILRERAAREKALAALRGQYAETIAITLSLQGRFDALPLNDFMHQADIKIAEMRQLLANDVAGYQESILQMTKELRNQADRLNKDLAERQAYLENVRALLESIKENNNLTFLTSLIDLKIEVEAALAQLSHDKMTLSGHITELTARTHDLRAHMTRNHTAARQIDDEMAALKKEMGMHREQAEASQRYMHRLGEEIAVAKRQVSQAQKEFEVLNSDLKEKLRGMQELAREGREQKDVVEFQVDEARKVLSDVRRRVMQLDAIAGQEERRVQELVDRVSTASATFESAYQPSDSVPRLKDGGRERHQSYTEKTSSKEEGAVASAVALLREMLSPFSTEYLQSAAQYRKAYLRFSMKNHPDKGGSSALFQAVDGLYKIVLDHNLFDAPSRFISYHVQSLLKQYSQQCTAHKSALRK